MTDPKILALARRLNALEASLRQRGEQLAYSALEDGAIREFDLNGNPVGQYGKQYDGTHVAASLSGPVPPTPTTPSAQDGAGGVLVGWDGTYAAGIDTVAPMDFTRVDVVIGAVGFDPIATPPAASIVSPRGGFEFVTVPPGDYEVALVTRSQAGVASVPSARATATALPVADAEELALAALEAAQAAADAEAALAAAAAASGAAGDALTAANGKNAITHAEFAPTNQANTLDDTWFVHAPAADGGAIIAQYTGLGGTSWVATSISHQVIASIDLGTATVGKLSANYLESGVLAAAITLSGMIIAGNPAGSRVVIDNDGIRQYDAAGNIVTNLPTDPAIPSTFEGKIIAQALTVNGFLTLSGKTNEMTEGAELRLASGIAAPVQAPSVAIDYAARLLVRTKDASTRITAHGGAADNDAIMAAGTDASMTTGEILNPAGGRYVFPLVLDNTGTPRGEHGAFTSGAVVYSDGEEKLVTMGLSTIEDEAPVGAIVAWGVGFMNSGGTTRPAAVFHPMTKDASNYKTKIGRVFSGVGSSTLRDQVAVAIRRSSLGNIVLRRYTVGIASFTQVGSDLTISDPIDPGEEIIGVTYGSSAKMGFPTDFNVWLLHSTNKTRVYNTAGTRLGVEWEFPHPSGMTSMQAWGDAETNTFLGFRATSFDTDCYFWQFTNTHWPTSESGTWWISNSWYDSNATGGTHETMQSPRASIAMRRRAGLTVTVPPFPEAPPVPTSDDVNAARIYIGRGATDPGRAAMDLVGTAAAPTRSIFVGTQRNVWLPVTTPPVAANTFSTATPAKVMSSDGTSWKLEGDGRITAAGVLFDGSKPGFASSVMEHKEFKGSVFSSGTTSSATAVAMGTRGGEGTFVAPPSGRVTVTVTAQLRHSVAGQYMAVGFEIREGDTIGSGTVVHPFDVNDSALNRNTQDVRASQTETVSSLTPGQTYNIRNMMAAQSATGSAAHGRIYIIPSP